VTRERFLPVPREGYLESAFVLDPNGVPWCPVDVPPRCMHCFDEGHVCEYHPDFPWTVKVEGHDGEACGGAGMPCPYCCSPIPADGTHSIIEAFTPDWRRG
jgi:hypothetical protein